MQPNKNKIRGILAATLIFSTGTIIAPLALTAATAAGKLIRNQATVTYEDDNGNQYSARSNEAIITVKQVFSAEIETDRSKTAAAGQTVYTQHTISNTGNGPDTYSLSIANETGDGNDAEALTLYLDRNGNGLADAGEPFISSSTISAGETVEVVVAAKIPNSALAGQTISTLLTVTSQADGTANIIDTGPNSDGLGSTNQDLITVTQDAVLNFTKTAVLDSTNHRIHYTLTISNTGNVAATGIEIFDALPDGTTYVANSAIASGLLTTNGDTTPNNQLLDEAVAAADLNDNNTPSETGVNGIYATDASLAPGAMISMQFAVKYDPATFNNDTRPGSGGDTVVNTGYLLADVDGDPSTHSKIPVSSNPTQTQLPQIFSLRVDDTNTGASPGINDGGDDDAAVTANDIQTVDHAPDGSTVLFPITLTNTGTGPDTLELSIGADDFPLGTTFTFWNAHGNVPLLDTNGAAGPDTGVLDAAEQTTVMITAKLPGNPTITNNVADGGNGYTATVIGNSSAAPPNTVVADTTTLFLADIMAPKADLRDTSTAASDVNDDALGNLPYNINTNLSNTSGDPAYTADAGTSVSIPFHIDNNSGSPDSFLLSAGSYYDGNTVSRLPSGWSVSFFKGDSSRKPIGQPLSNTALLSANSISNTYVAVVFIPSGSAMAATDYRADNDGDGTLDLLDANGDGDGDQPIFINIESVNSGASDIMLDAIDVNTVRSIGLAPPGVSQIQPGGTTTYAHVLKNTGNTNEALELSGNNSTLNWSNNILVQVDTTGNGQMNTSKPLSQLVPGTDRIVGTAPNGSPIALDVTDTDGDNRPEITLPSGVAIPMEPTVYAPTDAPPGTLDTLTVTAQSLQADPLNPDRFINDTSLTAPTTTVTDVSEVIAGRIHLSKTVAYDPDCDGIADSTFVVNLTDRIAPTECAIWEIVAENQGDAPATDVVIRDEITAFTTYLPNSLKYALGNGIAPIAVSDAVGNDAGEISGEVITFYIGTDADAAIGKGGTLTPGEFATVRFNTVID